MIKWKSITNSMVNLETGILGFNCQHPGVDYRGNFGYFFQGNFYPENRLEITPKTTQETRSKSNQHSRPGNN